MLILIQHIDYNAFANLDFELDLTKLNKKLL